MPTSPTSASRLFLAPLPPRKDGKKPNISKILIANRGEIACRVVKTCRLLGITSVAVYVDEDSRSLHVTEADEAVHLGSAEGASGDPYLNSERLVDIALAVGADAVHPGRGYLVDYAYFADAVRRAGLTFIGSRRRTLPSKKCKAYLAQRDSHLPIHPSFEGHCQDGMELKRAAARIGYPLHVETSSGERQATVRNAEQLDRCVHKAQFRPVCCSNDSVWSIEKHIDAPKYIGVHIIGDHHGRILYLSETDRSVRRGDQSIIEETPCPWLSSELRHSMKATAVHIANLLNLEGICTIEFVVDTRANQYYYLKVSAGLQVEYPVIEEVTGHDLVALQIFVAAGGNLNELQSLHLHQVTRSGHAIECELLSEEPNQDFQRQSGVIQHWRSYMPPAGGPYRSRYETAVQSGFFVSRRYDSLIARLVVWAPSRAEAMEGMTNVLRKTACIGVKTNQEFLQGCLMSAAFSDISYTSRLLIAEHSLLVKSPYMMDSPEVRDLVMLAPCLYEIGLAQHCERDGGWKKALLTLRANFRREHSEPTISTVRVISEVGKEDPLQATVIATMEYSNDSSWTSSLLMYPLSTFQSTVRLGSSASMQETPTSMFNALSAALRSGSTESWHAHGARVSRFRLVPWDARGATSRRTCPVAFFEACVDGLKTEVHVVRDFRRKELRCHLSAIGTWVALRSDSLLGFFGNLAAHRMKRERQPSSGTAGTPLPKGADPACLIELPPILGGV